MTTDPFPKEASVEIAQRGRHVPRRRHRQRLRHDRADDGDDAGVRDDRRGGAPALLQRALKDVVRRHVQRDHVDGECSTNDCVFALANGASGVGLGDGDYACSCRRCAHVCEPLAIGIVRGGEGATKLITVRVTGAASDDGRQARGARDRELAARQDRGPRRRSELGPAGRGRRAVGVRLSCSTPRRSASGRWSSSATAGRTTSARRRRPSICKEDNRRRSGPRHRRPRAVADVDLRSERGVRADQRRVPDIRDQPGKGQGRSDSRLRQRHGLRCRRGSCRSSTSITTAV